MEHAGSTKASDGLASPTGGSPSDGGAESRRTGSFMSKDYTDAVRGVLVLFVIIFHESNYLDIGILPREGSYAVFMFFILSDTGWRGRCRRRGI